ncbi:MAG: DNA mismatch repair protein MutS [Treponema sp.]|uniref:DNA mismatch repair protein MutS n=1 Tax=Treponema sp. TaxID=166 RepID=UPI0025E8E95B|nr:DNA mismatch repair protein MutS [Treponema sp.]MBQ8679000.1 DNA mismatch repair protein MutS [Treponema sp.]
MARSKDALVAGSVQSRAEPGELTPVMLQYLSIKEEHKDEVLFFRLGDFYEMFNQDAIEVSRLLNLTLTHRGAAPMCGIPFHAAKIYIARLLRCGKRIAICEQIGDPKAKGLTERKVIEIITPGTALESEYLDGGANNFLACLCLQKGRAGFAYLDVTTSDFFATSWYESDMEENFSKEIGRCHPRELLLPQSLEKNEIVQNTLLQNEEIAVSYYPDWNFDQSLSYKRLLAQFKTVNLQGFSLDEKSPEVAPAGFLLDYLQKTATTNAPHVTGIKVYRDSQFVIMDDSSRRNLEIVENLRDGSSQFSLLECLSHTETAMGKRLLRSWLLYPLTNVEEIRRRQNHVELFVKNRNLLEFVHELFGNILDIERLAGRVAMERAHAKDVQALRASLENWLKVREQLDSCGFTHTEKNLAEQIVSLIKNAILEDPATALGEGRIIKEGWSAELDEYRRIHDNVNKILDDYAEEEKAVTGIQNLRIRSNSLTGYYIEITRGKSEQVPAHFILRRALTNADRYTTVRLQEIEKQIGEAELKITETEKALFLELRSKIAEHTNYLLQTAKEIAYADVTSSLAYAALLHGWVKPFVDNSKDFIIKGGRHPVVELHLPSGEFVPNDIEISAEKESKSAYFALITGPNMAGKSTYLRQNALIALLAQIGSFVPAKEAHIGAVDRIFCRVGASDNLARGESTFLVEMTETAYILRTATEKSFVIMDEVGRGTSTEDGLSIAWAVSEYLLNVLKCKTLFATHYHELTRLDHPSLKLLCMEVSEEADKITFLRKIKEGASENSYGIHVASLAGLPQSVIRRANEILNTLQKGADSAVSENAGSLQTLQTSAEEKPLEKSVSMPGLFSDEELVLDEILSCDPDDMTPRQALDLVARWKKSLSGR